MEEMHKSIDSSSSSSGFDPDPNDSVHQSPAYEVNFGFNQLKIDENEPQSASDEVSLGFNKIKIDENKPQSVPDEVSLGFNKLKIDENKPQSTTDEVNFGFNQVKIDENEPHKQQSMAESAENEEDEEEEDDDEDEEEEEGEFTFMCIGENDSVTEEMFENGQIRPVFPLFDQSLLFGGDNDGDGKLRLPIHVPVDKVFIESPRRSPSSTASGVTTGTICAALPTESNSGTPEINIKSNSTGFSKLWRFRDKMNRSNSDGRDAFVFLETPQRTTTTIPSTSTLIGKANAGGGDDFPAKVTGAGGKGKVVNKKGSNKVKKVKASAHEVYLKQRGGQTEDERRRSYLPYRPGLMGFFTNVNGGLSKNVHPF